MDQMGAPSIGFTAVFLRITSQSAINRLIRFGAIVPERNSRVRSAWFLSVYRVKVYRYLLTVWLLALSGLSAAVESDIAQQRLENVTQVTLGILSYTRWPDHPEQLQLCITGPTEYADHLLMQPMAIANRPVVTRRVPLDDKALEDECHAVYIGFIPDAENKALFARLKDKAILSIAEQNDSCSTGSMFCLQFGRNGEVTFLVNLDSIARSAVRVHPNVLLLGKRRNEG